MRYRDAGVDIDAGEEAVRRIRDRVRVTHGPHVLTGLGAFGGACTVPGLDPEVLLVSSMDGVGTKTKVAALLGRLDTIGEDLVNHCVGDIGVHGADPLFFLDYVAMARLDPAAVAAVVEGVVRGCLGNGCALIGGETAEMPGVYAPGDVELVGTIVGTVRRGEFVDGATLRPGDVLLGFPSTGLHTNGYSLARRVLFETAGLDPGDPLADSDVSVGEALLAVHRSYQRPLRALKGLQKGAAHITGGGIPGNLVRILPPGTSARVRLDAWRVPPIFRLIADHGEVPRDDLYRTFNMGIGLIVGVPPDRVEEARERGGADARIVGEITSGPREVELVGDPAW
jgi:phosphoribosylformylglycinamidine cyclo-ligase